MNRILLPVVFSLIFGMFFTTAAAQELDSERNDRRIIQQDELRQYERQSESATTNQERRRAMELRERQRDQRELERQRAMMRRDRERSEDDRDFSPALAAYGTLWDSEDEPGWGAGGKVEVPLIEDILNVEARGAWVDDVQVDHNEDAELDVVPLDLGLALHCPGDCISDNGESWVRPLVMGGASWIFFDAPSGFDVDDEVGWYAGGGLEIGKQDGLGLLLEVIYRGVDIDLENELTGVTDKTDLDGVTANAGLYYRW